MFSVMNSCNPVAAGQTRSAFYVSAALVLVWFLGHASRASAEYLSGRSEDMYVRLEWMYDLDEGYGIISLTNSHRSPDGKIATDLRSLSFLTAGVRFDSVSGSLGRHLAVPEPSGMIQDLPAFAYRYSATPETSVVIPTVPPPAVIVVNFPTEGIELFTSKLQYGASVATGGSASIPIGDFTNSIDFVSVQAIPEPGTAGLLLAAGAGVGALGAARRRTQP